MSQTRRTFIEASAFAALPAWLQAAPDSATGMPTRMFGQTGSRVSCIAFGCGSRFLMYEKEEDGIAAIHRALELGITYFDTAYDYGRGLSETRVGKALAGRRKDVFLVTKLPERNGDAAMRTLEGSLKRLQTDQLDNVHIHSLTTEQDLKAIEAKDGVLQALYKARDQKITRNIGISCHTDPKVLATALERHDFNCTQMALNGARVGNVAEYNGDVAHNSFESLALPIAIRKKLGVTAIKIFAQEKLVGKAPIKDLIRYSLSLPIGAAVLGMPKREHLEENVAAVRGFQPVNPEDRRKMNDALGVHKASIDAFFSDHVDA